MSKNYDFFYVNVELNTKGHKLSKNFVALLDNKINQFD